MPNHNRKTRIAVLAIAISLAAMLGATGRCFGDEGEDGDIGVTLQPNQDVGAAFGPSMGSGPEYSPQGDFFDVEVTLTPAGNYFIVPPTAAGGDGEVAWNCTAGSAGLAFSQTWEGIGTTDEDGWSDVFFAGTLMPLISGTGPGTLPPFYASVADISIYVDALQDYSDEAGSREWPPVISWEEHDAETTEYGPTGFYVPPSMVTTGTGGFPAQLPANSNYKILILRLLPRWSGPPNPATVGSLTFSLPSGLAIYDGDTFSLVTGAIRVPAAGLCQTYYLLTDQNFTSAGCIKATFTWDTALAGGPPTAQDYARIAPVTVAKIQWAPNSGWEDVTDPMYVCVGQTVVFQAVPDPDPTNPPWPSDAPTWGGKSGASGTGNPMVVTFTTASSSATDYKTVTATYGNTVTANVVVVQIKITNIKFNYGTGSPALNIRQDYATPYDLSNGEWVSGGHNFPVAYVQNTSITIQARFTITPSCNITADVSAACMDWPCSLSDISATTVTFANGLSSPEYVSLSLSRPTWDCVEKTTDDTWQWRVQNINDTGSPVTNINTSGPHTVYTVLAQPVSPWNNTPGSPMNPWVSALDFVISTGSCNCNCIDALTNSAAMAHITLSLQGTGFGMTYDTLNGAAHFVNPDGSFDFTGYMGGNRTVNCYDQANGVALCSTLLGIPCTVQRMAPFGYILQTNLVGIGQCNNPFYPNYAAPNNSPTLPIASLVLLQTPFPACFGCHFFVQDSNSQIYDATCGPHLGTESLLQYATDAIDISILAAQQQSPDTNPTWNGVFTQAEVNADTAPSAIPSAQ